MKQSKLAIAILALAAPTLPTHAVISYVGLETNAAAELQNGSWSGGGTLQPNLVPGTSGGFGEAPGNSGILVDNFTGSGALGINQLASGGRLAATSSVVVTISVAGGTADLVLANSNNFDLGANNFNSVQLWDLAGVTSVSVNIDYDQLIAGRSFATNLFGAAPMGGAASLVDGGGIAASGFEITASYLGVVSSVDGVNFSSGPGSFVPTATNVFDTPAAGDTTLSADSYPVSEDWVVLKDWVLLKGYDVDGDGAYDIDDADNVYIDSVTFTITPDSGTFNAGTIFNFSLDGEQYGNLPVPESSTALLILLAAFGGTLHRRRHQ